MLHHPKRVGAIVLGGSEQDDLNNCGCQISLFVTNSFISIEGNTSALIAEEANPCQIKVKTIRSDHNKLIVAGSNCYVYATYSLQLGWVVRTACCREGEDTSNILAHLRFIDEKGLQIPFKSKWVAPVLWTTIKETPGILYQMMCEILKPYISEYAMTNNILQEARGIAKLNLLVSQKITLNTPMQLQRQLRTWVTQLSSSSQIDVQK